MPDPAPIHEHAFDNLRYIREAMERASAFTSIPGWGGVLVGLSAVITAVIAHPRPASKEWLWIWLIDAFVAASIGGVAMARKAKQANVSFTGAPARRFFVSYLAPITAAAILTLLLARLGMFAALPATWLLLYGASFISSGAYSIRVVPVMGVCFMVLGLIACFVPFSAGNMLMAAGFGGLHIIFGFIIARSYGG
jgi:hypothetical protein